MISLIVYIIILKQCYVWIFCGLFYSMAIVFGIYWGTCTRDIEKEAEQTEAQLGKAGNKNFISNVL